jgi:hypothetical protein
MLSSVALKPVRIEGANLTTSTYFESSTPTSSSHPSLILAACQRSTRQLETNLSGLLKGTQFMNKWEQDAFRS